MAAAGRRPRGAILQQREMHGAHARPNIQQRGASYAVGDDRCKAAGSG